MNKVGQHFNASKSDYIDTEPDDDDPIFLTAGRLKHEKAAITKKRGTSRMQVSVPAGNIKKEMTAAASRGSHHHHHDEEAPPTAAPIDSLQQSAQADQSHGSRGYAGMQIGMDAAPMDAIVAMGVADAAAPLAGGADAAAPPHLSGQIADAAPARPEEQRRSPDGVPRLESMTVLGSQPRPPVSPRPS